MPYNAINKVLYNSSPSQAFALDCISSSSISFALNIFLSIFSSSGKVLLSVHHFNKEPLHIMITIQLCPLCVSLSKLLQQMLHFAFFLFTLNNVQMLSTYLHALQECMHTIPNLMRGQLHLLLAFFLQQGQFPSKKPNLA